jgi:hypothetical protein
MPTKFISPCPRWWQALLLLWVLPLAACSSSDDDAGAKDESVLAPLVRDLMPPKPSEAVRWALTSPDPDKRREGIALLSGATFGGENVYIRVYRLRADDTDATVRAASIRALGLWGKVDEVPNLLRFAHEDSGLVRWEMAQALQKIHNPLAIHTLTVMVSEDKDADVRMAAAIALGQYARPEVFSALVGALDDTEWGVTDAAHESLVCLTGEDFGADEGEWLKYQQSHAGRLFEHQRQYVWYPFVKPRGFWDKVKFWSHPPDVPPRVPTGMETATTSPGEAPKS